MGLLSRASANAALPGKVKTAVVPDSTEAKVRHFFEIYRVLNCIVFKTPGDKNLSGRIQKIIDRMGTVIDLGPGVPLILLRGTVDRDLISHRLSKNLGVPPLMSFGADSPESLFKKIGKV